MVDHADIITEKVYDVYIFKIVNVIHGAKYEFIG